MLILCQKYVSDAGCFIYKGLNNKTVHYVE